MQIATDITFVKNLVFFDERYIQKAKCPSVVYDARAFWCGLMNNQISENLAGDLIAFALLCATEFSLAGFSRCLKTARALGSTRADMNKSLVRCLFHFFAPCFGLRLSLTDESIMHQKSRNASAFNK
jgi:hypothetical protein